MPRAVADPPAANRPAVRPALVAVLIAALLSGFVLVGHGCHGPSEDLEPAAVPPIPSAPAN